MRVTVTGGGRRADVALPESVPVAELLPVLADTLGLLTPDEVHRGHRLCTLGGGDLDGELGLAPQGVSDGAVLVVAAAGRPDPPVRHDDVAEAVAEAVVDTVTPWSAAASRRTALGAGSALLLAALVALVARGGALAAVAAAGGAVVLGGLAVLADRGRSASGVAGVLACLATAYAATAAAAAAPPGAGWGGAVAAAGAGAFLVGLVGLVALRRARPVAVTPVLLGGVVALAGLAVAVGGADPVTVVLVGLVLVVLAGDLVPRTALGVAGVGPSSRVETPVASTALRSRVRSAHAVALAAVVAVGATLALAAPVAVAAGGPGAGLIAAAAAVVGLRARHHRGGAEVLAACAAAAAGLVVAAVVGTFAHPGWRLGAAFSAGLVGLAAVVVALLPVTTGARVRRLADVVEALAVVALLPLLVLAVGWYDALRG